MVFTLSASNILVFNTTCYKNKRTAVTLYSVLCTLLAVYKPRTHLLHSSRSHQGSYYRTTQISLAHHSADRASLIEHTLAFHYYRTHSLR
jgi:hypothetical protein